MNLFLNLHVNISSKTFVDDRVDASMNTLTDSHEELQAVARHPQMVSLEICVDLRRAVYLPHAGILPQTASACWVLAVLLSRGPMLAGATLASFISQTSPCCGLGEGNR